MRNRESKIVHKMMPESFVGSYREHIKHVEAETPTPESPEEWFAEQCRVRDDYEAAVAELNSPARREAWHFKEISARLGYR